MVFEHIDPKYIPAHVAIIMDGNRRWARQNGLPESFGHKKGADNIEKVIKAATNLGVKVMTAFAFSTENWNRSQVEVKLLLKLLMLYLRNKKKILVREGIRLRTIGDLTKFPPKVVALLEEVMVATKDGRQLDLVLALNYGSRDEIKRACAKIIEDVLEKKIQKQEVTENLISSYLDTSLWKDPDLLIRTSGEERLSNFLLWQLSYTEIYTTKTMWPDFGEKEFLLAIKEFQRRERRFGE